MIALTGVRFTYDGRSAVLEGASLAAGAGLTLLLGPNGCGKSTLLKILAGVEKPDAGSVAIEGKDLWVEEAQARRPLAYVPEQPDLSPYATVGEILRFVARVRGEPAAQAEAALAAAGLDGLGGRSVRELSMGQRRRAVLAAAWIGRPRVILLDEPLEAMDRAMREAILVWIDARVAERACLVVVTHEIEPFVARAARAVTVREGRPELFDPLPPDPAGRLALLESLARGETP